MGPPPDDPDGADLDRFREAAQQLLAAGQHAIDRTISGNSEAFLKATRQQGGQ